MKFLIVGGFLGSGKTSFILALARYLVQTRGITKVAILENEIGEVGVDDRVLRGSGYRVKGMFDGCVCCTMAGELLINVRMIQEDYNPDWIIMEPTGMAFPGSIRQNLQDTLDIHPVIVCLADAQRWQKILKPLGHLLSLQMKDADLILLNKADLAEPGELDAARESIRELNARAEILCISTAEGIDSAVFDRILELGGTAYGTADR